MTGVGMEYGMDPKVSKPRLKKEEGQAGKERSEARLQAVLGRLKRKGENEQKQGEEKTPPNDA